MRFILLLILFGPQNPTVTQLPMNTEPRCEKVKAQLEERLSATPGPYVLECIDTGSAVGPLSR
jgi:hypothetical protein